MRNDRPPLLLLLLFPSNSPTFTHNRPKSAPKSAASRISEEGRTTERTLKVFLLVAGSPGSSMNSSHTRSFRIACMDTAMLMRETKTRSSSCLSLPFRLRIHRPGYIFSSLRILWTARDTFRRADGGALMKLILTR